MAAASLAYGIGRLVGPLGPIREWLADPAATEPEPLRDGTVRMLVDAHADALMLADRAAALDFNGFPGGFDYSYRASSLAMLSHLIAARTVALSAAGRGDEAVSSALSGLAARRAMRDSNFFGASLFGPRCETAAILSLSQPASGSLIGLTSAAS